MQDLIDNVIGLLKEWFDNNTILQDELIYSKEIVRYAETYFQTEIGILAYKDKILPIKFDSDSNPPKISFTGIIFIINLKVL